MWREKIMIIGNECGVRIKRPILSNISPTCETTPVVFEYICWDIGGIICDPWFWSLYYFCKLLLKIFDCNDYKITEQARLEPITPQPHLFKKTWSYHKFGTTTWLWEFGYSHDTNTFRLSY